MTGPQPPVSEAEPVEVLLGESFTPHAGVLGDAEILHLLRRLTFGPTPALWQALRGKTALEAVDMLLGGEGQEEPATAPGGWVNTATENPQNADDDTRQAIEGSWRGNHRALQRWWVGLMVGEALPAREKLTLCWSSHYTTEFDSDVGEMVPQLLYRQNQMLRRDRLTDFPRLTMDITLDSAMLFYLGGELNVKGRPNENYARELLELYTIGLGGRYTEGDIHAIARVLTGWKASKFNDEPALKGIYNAYFIPDDHDTGVKEFLGERIDGRSDDKNNEFLVRNEEVQGLIDIIFRVRSAEAAAFLAQKVVRFFVYSNPAVAAERLTSCMATSLLNHNFAIRPALRELFTSAEFFEARWRGVQIAMPSEFVAGVCRLLGIAPGDITDTMADQQQVLMDPPTVAGWDGWRTWISTKTLPARYAWCRALLAGSFGEPAARDFARSIPSFGASVDADLDVLLSLVFPRAVSPARRAAYRETLLGLAPDYEWPAVVADTSALRARLEAFFLAAFRAPDAHLR